MQKWMTIGVLLACPTLAFANEFSKVISYEKENASERTEQINLIEEEPEESWDIKNERILARQNFILKQDHLYGEYVFPKGTLINRRDSGDMGEKSYPLILGGFEAARFEKPTKIAGVLASAVGSEGYVELAEAQEVGPVYYYPKRQGIDGLVLDRTTPTILCKKGTVAVFEKKMRFDRDYDAPDWWKEKDGAEADFRPSEWQFRHCDDEHKIDVLPAFGSKEALKREKEEEAALKKAAIEDNEEKPVVLRMSMFIEGLDQYLTAPSMDKETQYSHYASAYQLFKQAAENEEKDAYYYLGIMNYYGQGVPRNIKEASYWLNKAVDIGNMQAYAILGEMYLKEDTIKDTKRALDIFKQAAAKGDLTAEYHLGVMYIKGDGVVQNHETGLTWLKKASHPTHAVGMTGYDCLSIQAMITIGNLYSEGIFGKKDMKAAEPWYEKASNLGAEKTCNLLDRNKLSAQ